MEGVLVLGVRALDVLGQLRERVAEEVGEVPLGDEVVERFGWVHGGAPGVLEVSDRTGAEPGRQPHRGGPRESSKDGRGGGGYALPSRKSSRSSR